MKNAQTIYNEQKLNVKDSLSNDFEEKLVKYGWLCQVEIVNELACDDEEKYKILKQISIKRGTESL